MHSGGKTLHLQAGHYCAKIVTVGAFGKSANTLAKSRGKRLLST